MDDHIRHNMQDLARRWTASQPAVAAFVSSLIFDAHDAEEVLQNTAAALVARHEQYNSDRPFVGWAIGVARVEVLRFRDSRRREGKLFVFDTATVEAVAKGFEATTLDLPAIRPALDLCLEKLKGRMREVFELHHVEALSPSEIATRLDRTPNAVMVMLHRGRASIRDCLRNRLALEGVQW